jgi:hypothetical protein
MDYNKAFKILEINLSELKYNDITLEYLNKQYRKQALKHHPDKNGNTYDSTEKFKEINEAYNYLKKEMKHFNTDTNVNYENIDEPPIYYLNILKEFIQLVFKDSYTDLLNKVINEIIISGKNISIKLFDEFDKETTLNIYNFLSTNKNILHINNDILNCVRDVLIKKYNNIEIYKINPSMNDLINNNLYKLFINEKLLLVPLWNRESYFDISGKEIIVICEPELPNNIDIDDENNIHIKIEISAYNDLPNMILTNDDLCFNLGDKTFNIQICNLLLKREQYYTIYGEGLSKEKEDIYDISEKGDIIINIKMI